MYQDNSNSGVSSSDGDSTGFDVGIGYKQGPILLGLSWMHSEVGTTSGAEAELDVVALGATYKLGKGVVVYAEGFWVDAQNATDEDLDNEAFGLILGTTVKF
jgi:predicted porin